MGEEDPCRDTLQYNLARLVQTCKLDILFGTGPVLIIFTLEDAQGWVNVTTHHGNQ